MVKTDDIEKLEEILRAHGLEDAVRELRRSDRVVQPLRGGEVRIQLGGELRVEQRAEGAGTLVGTAPPWEVLSAPIGWGFREKFQRGAFRNVGKPDTDVICTFEHDGRALLGRTMSGTLELVDSERGLEYRCQLPDTQPGRDLAVSVSRGDVRGSSFEFTIMATGDEWEDGELKIRTVTDAVLHQVGPVTNPAYPVGTDVALRSFARTFEADGADPDPERLAIAISNELRRRRLDLLELDV